MRKKKGHRKEILLHTFTKIVKRRGNTEGGEGKGGGEFFSGSNEINIGESEREKVETALSL